jgi:hypothetical protein
MNFSQTNYARLTTLWQSKEKIFKINFEEISHIHQYWGGYLS